MMSQGAHAVYRIESGSTLGLEDTAAFIELLDSRRGRFRQSETGGKWTGLTGLTKTKNVILSFLLIPSE
jgi:hypothetical protein